MTAHTSTPADPADGPTAAERAHLARQARNLHTATLLEYVDELAPSLDVARKARVRLASAYGLAAASLEDVRTVVADLTRPDPEESLA